MDEHALSAHDEKLLGARQRRQRQLAEKRGSGSAGLSGSDASGPNFERVQNFGAGGVVGFLVQSGATGGGGGSSSGPAGGGGSAVGGGTSSATPIS